MSPPRKATGAGRVNDRPRHHHSRNDESNGATPQAVEQIGDDDAKLFATLKARAALLGCALYRLADGSLLLTSGATAWCRECPDLHAAQAVLRQMAGR